jgi:hypothetical protein
MRARLSMLNLEYTDAAFYLKAILKVYPSDYDAGIAMCHAHIALGNISNAHHQLQFLACLYPESMEIMGLQNTIDEKK